MIKVHVGQTGGHFRTKLTENRKYLKISLVRISQNMLNIVIIHVN